MIDAPCPECGVDGSHTVTDDSGTHVEAVCADCGHKWDVEIAPVPTWPADEAPGAYRYQPGPTMPPPVPGETRLEAARDAVAWEYRRRLAGGVKAAPTEHAHAFAVVALTAADRVAKEDDT